MDLGGWGLPEQLSQRSSVSAIESSSSIVPQCKGSGTQEATRPALGSWGLEVAGVALSLHSGRKCHLNQARSQTLLACGLAASAPSHLPHRGSQGAFVRSCLYRRRPLVLFLTARRYILRVTVPWTQGKCATRGFGRHHLCQM